MRLSELLAGMKNAAPAGAGDPCILFITADSRSVEPGALFAALPGSREDGTGFIREAVERGAAALLTERLPQTDPGIPYLVASDARKALGEAADSFYAHPSRSLELIGVTGTNGKTTTAYLVRHIFNQAERRCGMLGTIEYDLGDKVEPAPLTTPDAVRFTRSLAEMRDFGCKTAVVETSSHALSQDRVWPHRFACGIFTNLTRDHLDYHGDMDSYLAAKKLLFQRLDASAKAVVNLRDPRAGALLEGISARIYGYIVANGEKYDTPRKDAYRVEILSGDLSGQRFRMTGPGLDREFSLPLVGRHNVENASGAILAAYAMGVPDATIGDALAGFPGVPGRLERVAGLDGVTAFVDYAHTDDALRSVISVLRPLAKKRLITVFGCGGDRDRGKRPLMAKAAEEASDVVVVTSDNPRTEDPGDIIDDILPGFADRGKVEVDRDREKAINLAVRLAQPGDTLLVAGKGHEDYQIVGTEKRHFDDREILREAFGGKR